MGKPRYALKTSDPHLNGCQVFFDRHRRPFIRSNYYVPSLKVYKFPEDAEVIIPVTGEWT